MYIYGTSQVKEMNLKAYDIGEYTDRNVFGEKQTPEEDNGYNFINKDIWQTEKGEYVNDYINYFRDFYNLNKKITVTIWNNSSEIPPSGGYRFDNINIFLDEIDDNYSNLGKMLLEKTLKTLSINFNAINDSYNTVSEKYVKLDQKFNIYKNLLEYNL